MSRTNQLSKYKKHLEERYRELVQRAQDYKYEDEVKSDLASYKAMKVLEKLNRIRFLNKDLTNSLA